MTIDITIAIAIVGCLLGIIAFADGRRKMAIMEGRYQEAQAQMERRVTEADAVLSGLRSCYQSTDADIREIKTNIEWIKKGMDALTVARGEA